MTGGDHRERLGLVGLTLPGMIDEPARWPQHQLAEAATRPERAAGRRWRSSRAIRPGVSAPDACTTRRGGERREAVGAAAKASGQRACERSPVGKPGGR